MVIHGIGRTRRNVNSARAACWRRWVWTAAPSANIRTNSAAARSARGHRTLLTLNPEVLVLDEAVSALDVSVQAQVLNLLKDLQDEFGLAYVFISHDLAVVRFISDEVLVMKDGIVVEQASAAQILAAPREDYTKRLLAAIPRGYRPRPPDHRGPTDPGP